MKRSSDYREDLVTNVTEEVHGRIVALLAERGSSLTPIKWLARVARYRVARFGFRPFAREHVVEAARSFSFSPRVARRRLLASVPIGIAGGHQGLGEARWARVLIAWALAERLVPAREAVPATLKHRVAHRRAEAREKRVAAVREALGLGGGR